MNVEPMPQSRIFPLVVYHALRECVRRSQYQGWRGGWNCFRAHALNFRIRLANRFFKEKRFACPCCGWTGWSYRILDVGLSIVHGVECPQCKSQERHRMLFLFFSRHLPEFMKSSTSRILHLSPEKILVDLLSRESEAQIMSMDIDPLGIAHAEGACFASDLMALSVKNEVFDAVIGIHVLEHVLDDRKSLAEIYRILRPGGAAFLMVPFGPIPETCEWGEPNVLLFGHVRDYSIHDFAKRLNLFEVKEITPEQIVSGEELQRYSIPSNQIIYLCTKK